MTTGMINFMKWRWVYLAISLLVIVPGAFSLVRFGLKPGIDFTGGSLLELELQQPNSDFNLETVQPVIGETYEVNALQASGPSRYLLRGKAIDNQQKDEAVSKMTARWGPMTELRFATVGPVLGQELVQKTLIAAFLASTFITIFLARQFHELKYGVCAVLAVLHDSLVLLGVFSLLGVWWGVEVDVLFVTALLTTLSFSVHDTIVVYDRIREFRRLHPRATLEEVINAAVLQTLGRSLNNSLTIIIMLLALVLMGGETIRWFAVALLVGAVTGTYSSTFTAAPLLLVWEQFKKKK